MMPWWAFLIIEVVQFALFGFIVWLLENGRNRLLRAVISKNASEYAQMSHLEEKSLTNQVFPVVSDEYEAYIEGQRTPKLE